MTITDDYKIIIRYGEIGTKSRHTRKRFEQILKNNIEMTLKKYDIESEVEILHTRLLLTVDKYNMDKSLELLRKIPGIVSFSPCLECDLNIKDIENFSIGAFKGELTQYINANIGVNKTVTFAVKTQRIKKQFNMNSMELSRHIGAVIINEFDKIKNENEEDEQFKNINLKVNLKNPDISVRIEIIDKAYIFTKRIEGVGGIPVGTQGKVLVLLSDGIDSPVASYLMIKRGCNAIFLHLKISEEGLKKTEKIFNILNAYHYTSKFLVQDYKEELQNIKNNLKKNRKGKIHLHIL